MCAQHIANSITLHLRCYTVPVQLHVYYVLLRALKEIRRDGDAENNILQTPMQGVCECEHVKRIICIYCSTCAVLHTRIHVEIGPEWLNYRKKKEKERRNYYKALGLSTLSPNSFSTNDFRQGTCGNWRSFIVNGT